MKKCLKCGRIYNDETLSFCTEDGTTLSVLSYDAEATLFLPKQKTNAKSHRKIVLTVAAVILLTISTLIYLLFIGKDNSANRNVAVEVAPKTTPSPIQGTMPTPISSPNPATTPKLSSTPNPTSATEADQTELEIIGYDGTITFLSNPSIAYPSGFGPSKDTKGIAVRRGVEESTLLWSRIRMLRFKSRQEKNDKGVTVWRHTVEATLADGAVIGVELKDDWNMAYMGGGGTGLLFGQTDLGETQIPFSKISVLKVLKYARPEKK